MPQTLSEIRAMLASAGLSPRKSFGQHFLIDHNLLAIMVKLSNVGPGDVVLEVGPGTGTLTDALLATGAKVLAVEIDRGLAGLLADRYAGTSALRLICCDVLADKHNISGEVLQALHQFGTDCVHLVSNLPYNIATPLICECLLSSSAAARADRQAVMFKTLTITIQREMAERLTAKPGTDAYGPAAVLVSLLGEVQLGKRIPASAFWPAPKVTSQMLRIDFANAPIDQIPDLLVLRSLLGWLFHQRRKKIGSATRNRSSPFSPEAFTAALADAGVDPNVRPECVSATQLARIAALLGRLAKTLLKEGINPTLASWELTGHE